VQLPDLDALEPTVADQLRHDHQEVLRLLKLELASPEDLAAGFGLLGKTLHAYELYSSAEPCYRNASKLQPSRFDWVYLLAEVIRNLGRLDEAAGLFSHAAELAPDNAVVQVRIGDCLLQQNKLDAAQQAYDKALELAPSLAAAHAGLGKVALAKGEYDHAIEHLGIALQAVPDANQLHYSLAMAYRGLGDLERAQEHLQLSGQVGLRVADPLVDGLREQVRGEMAYLLRGRLAFNVGRFDEAAANFAAAVRAAPTSVRALTNLGSAIGMLGDTEGAILRFREALKLDPNSFVVHYNLGELCLGSGRHLEAVHYLEQAVKARPDDVRSQVLLARAYQQTGKPERALSVYDTALELAPGSEEAFLGKAVVLAQLQRYPEAITTLEEALQELPQQGRLVHALARLLAACPDTDLRDGERAVALARLVVAAAPEPRHVATLVLALAETGQCERAAEWQKQLILHAIREQESVEELRRELEVLQAGPPCRPPL